MKKNKDIKENEQHCGFIGLIGRPNVGKSTLLNQLVGQKVSITAHKAQTTRNRILGIRTEQNTQIVFIDTPGIHRAEKLLNRKIVAYATETLRDTDLNLWIVEPLLESSLQKKELSFLHLEDQKILTLLSAKVKRTVLVLNKIDTIPQEQALVSMDKLAKLGDFAEIVPISALKSTNVEHLVETLKKYLSIHPFYFENKQVTDVSERFLASEFVREELFMRLQQEIPYSIAVVVEQFKEDQKYDIICKRLYNEWDEVEHFHKHIVDKESLIAGTGYQLKYPERVKNAAIALKEKYSGKELGR